jgi:hypothetical protein
MAYPAQLGRARTPIGIAAMSKLVYGAYAPRSARANTSAQIARTSWPCRTQSVLRSHQATNSSNESCTAIAWVRTNVSRSRL